MLTDPDDAFGLPGWPRYWGDALLAGQRWPSGNGAWRTGREGGFVFALLYFVIAGNHFLGPGTWYTMRVCTPIGEI